MIFTLAKASHACKPNTDMHYTCGRCHDALTPQISCTLYKHTMLRALLEGTSLAVYLEAEVTESSPQNQQEPRGTIISTRLAWPDEYLLSNASHMI